MAFRIESVNKPEFYVDFELEQNDGKIVEFSIPKSDCLPPSTLKKLNEFIAAQDSAASVVEVNRETLKILVPAEKKTFDNLTQHQMEAIFKHWNAESGVTLGESEASTTS
ncbi:hypothetical protein [Corynebacterium sp.]|jgi:hypothetical protein|uniref:hypothetical protein n=1 Tax=Corynebacterium sp. TaxID=1720 RepID=UPI0025BFCA79|nr:hypothetical protein [Corynebacterium sp.]